MFKVLSATYALSTVGQGATHYSVARLTGETVYKAKVMLQELVRYDLVTFRSVWHREDVTKRLYSLTSRGKRVMDAYGSPAIGG